MNPYNRSTSCVLCDTEKECYNINKHSKAKSECIRYAFFISCQEAIILKLHGLKVERTMSNENLLRELLYHDG